MRRVWGRHRAGVSTAVVLVTMVAGCAWQNELVSSHAAGADSANGEIPGPWSRWSSMWSLSPDGEKVAFATTASDLGPTDTNDDIDVYVKDLSTGTYALVSANGDGADSGNGTSYRPAFSPDGTKILFTSLAGDLGPTDTNDGEDLYVRDLENGTTSLVTVNSTGTDSGAGRAFDAAFGPDGTKVLFISTANDLGPTDSPRGDGSPGGEMDVYVRDLTAGTTSLVSGNAAGTDSANAGSTRAQFSPDGTKVVFETQASNLGPFDGAAGSIDVYVRDLVTGATSLVSANAWGLGGGNGGSENPSFSPDGRKVLFTSIATDLGPGGSICWAPGRHGMPPMAYPCPNVFIRDLVTRTTSLVSVNIWGLGGGSGISGWGIQPQFSPDGTKVLFASDAGDLTFPGGNGYDVYIRDLVWSRTSLVTVNAGGTGGSNGTELDARFDPSGTRVVFSTEATDLGITDTNGSSDVYVRDLVWNTTNPVSINHDRTATGNGESRMGGFSHDGGHVLFWSTASDLVATDTNGYRDLFLASVYIPPSSQS